MTKQARGSASSPRDDLVTPMLAVVGPTASGKSEAAIPLAEALGAEIVSVDAMLVYRGMDVGTAKPEAADRTRVAHHLIDLVDPLERFSVARYQSLAEEAIRAIRIRGRTPLLVGGSGLYYRAIVDRLMFPATEARVRTRLEAEAALVGAGEMHQRLASVDPDAAGRIEPANVRRTVRALEVAAITGRPFSSFAAAWERYQPGLVHAAGIDLPRPALHRRIERRVAGMMPGLLAETERLMRHGFAPFLTSSQAIGYAEAVNVLTGTIDAKEAAGAVVKRTKALARRQMAWFRRDPRIRWFTAGEDGALGIVQSLVDYLREGGGQRSPGSWAPPAEA